MNVAKSPYAATYFHGKITRDRAEDLLMSQGAIEGSFLLRESVAENFVVSLCHNNKVHHYNIEKQPHGTFQILTGRKFIGPIELVEHHMLHLDGFLALARIPLERYPTGASYYILQGVKSSLFEDCLRKKAIEMGLKDNSTIEEALSGPMRKHLKYLVLKEFHLCQPWFHHFIRRLEAERRLEIAGYTEGQFLVRQRKDDNGFVLSLSFQNQPKHYRINDKLEKLFIDGGQYFDTLIELIDHYHFRQDGLLCKLRFAIECPGYVRSRSDGAQNFGDICFEGCHTSVCGVQAMNHLSTTALKTHLPKRCSDRSRDMSTESEQRAPMSEILKNGPDLISFNEWSTNLTKILNTQVSSSMTNLSRDTCPLLSPDDLHPSGNVFRLIRSNISSPQSILSSVKEIFHFSKSNNQKDVVTLEESSKGLMESQILDQIWTEPEIAPSSQMVVHSPDQEQLKVRSKSSSMPTKLQSSDLTFLDPLFTEKTQKIYDALPSNDHSFNLAVENLEIKHKLGGGNFGYVYGGVYKTSQGISIPVAVKMLKKEVHSFVAAQEILTEAATMAKLMHRHIVRLIGVCKSDQILLVLELAPLGPINKYLRRNTHTAIWTLVELMSQVAKGMAYLEAFKFVHRDLAARNVLLVNENYAKISDFGMSKALNCGHEYYRAAAAGKWPLKWYAPECIYYFRFDSKSDVWSYGITLWEVFSYGERPYKDLKGTEILSMLDKGQRLRKPLKCPDYIYEVMLQCWTIDGIRRPTFAELVLTMSRVSNNTSSSIRELIEHVSYQATSSGSSVAKTSYGSGDFSHFPMPPSCILEMDSWNKSPQSADNNDIVNW